MNPFKELDAQHAQASGGRPPIYCSVPGCERYIGKGQYARSYADICFTKPDGTRVELCGWHYLKGIDACGVSVDAQLRRDPDSIPSQLRRALRDHEV